MCSVWFLVDVNWREDLEDITHRMRLVVKGIALCSFKIWEYGRIGAV